MSESAAARRALGEEFGTRIPPQDGTDALYRAHEIARADVWTWRRTVAVSSLVALPTAVGSSVAGADDRLLTASSLVWLTRSMAFLIAAAVLYLMWRTFQVQAIRWLSAAFLAFTIFNAPFAMLAVSSPELRGDLALLGPPGLLMAACILLMLLVAASREGKTRRTRPIRIAVVVGTLAGAGRYVEVAGVPEPWLAHQALMPVMVVAGVVIGTAIGWAATRLVVLPRWARLRVALVCLGVTVSAAVNPQGMDGPAWQTVLAIGVDLVCAVTLVLTFLQLALISQAAQRRELAALAARADRAELSARDREEMLHEVRSTLSGITSVSRLLRHHHDRLPPGRTEHLEEMLVAELDRIQRLMSTDTPVRPRMVELDGVLGPVVETQQALGQDVRWQPSGLSVFVRPDDVAEALHTLLSNAFRHAPGATVGVVAAARACTVEVHVSDDGPGVPPEVHQHLFARGSRGPRSSGQGIGLYLAERILSQQGGGLRLEEAPGGRGADFVMVLPSGLPEPVTVPRQR